MKLVKQISQKFLSAVVLLALFNIVVFNWELSCSSTTLQFLRCLTEFNLKALMSVRAGFLNCGGVLCLGSFTQENGWNQGTACSTVSSDTAITGKPLHFRATEEDTSVGQPCSREEDSMMCYEHGKCYLTQLQRCSFFLLLWKNCFAT